MHRLLQRQLMRYIGHADADRFPPELAGLINAVDAAYDEADVDRHLLERSLELSSRELVQSNAEMRAMLKAFPDMLFRVEPDGTIIDMRAGESSGPYRLSGTLIGRRIQDIPVKPVAELFCGAIETIAKGKESTSIEYELSGKSGARRYEARLLRIKNAQIFVVVRDVTERSELEARMRQSEKLSAVGQLAAGVAHEINNPLGVILGFAQSLAHRANPSDTIYMPLKSIEREALRCKALVQGLLQFSRRSGDKMEEVGVMDAVTSALTLVMPQAKMKTIKVIQEIGPCGVIKGDKTQLQQMMINLCLNAIDAMPECGTLSVRSACRRSQDGVRRLVIEVEDNGPGIPKAIHDKIFEPFFTTKEPGKGTGLGLSLVYEFVRKHGGTIAVRSELGEGTTFVVEFPISPSYAHVCGSCATP